MLKNGAKNGFSSTGRGKRHAYGNLAVGIVYQYYNLTIQGLGAGIFGILELWDTLIQMDRQHKHKRNAGFFNSKFFPTIPIFVFYILDMLAFK